MKKSVILEQIDNDNKIVKEFIDKDNNIISDDTPRYGANKSTEANGITDKNVKMSHQQFDDSFFAYFGANPAFLYEGDENINPEIPKLISFHYNLIKKYIKNPKSIKSDYESVKDGLVPEDCNDIYMQFIDQPKVKNETIVNEEEQSPLNGKTKSILDLISKHMSADELAALGRYIITHSNEQ